MMSVALTQPVMSYLYRVFVLSHVVLLPFAVMPDPGLQVLVVLMSLQYLTSAVYRLSANYMKLQS